jgi:tripartite-type tricarboxylate transporter receptor subunit TctC
MKKLFMVSILIFVLVAAGCAQTSKQAGVSKSSGSGSGSVASAEKPKSKFPEKPIQLIVPYDAGGLTDLSARVMANAASKYLPNGQSVVVVNKPGGSGTIGTTEVFQAKPDGYTLGMGAINATSIQPHYGQTPYTHDSFQAVIQVLSAPQVLIVQANAPWKTFEEWLDYVKNNPGKFTYATGGKGHTTELALEALSSAAGLQTKPVPFNGANPAITALLGGHVQGAVVQASEAKPQIEAGAVRTIINLGSIKADGVKDVPLAKEKGYKDVSLDGFTGIIATKGIPQDVLNILHDSFKKALEDPNTVAEFKKLGVDTVYAGPQDFQKTITDTFNLTGQILKKIGLIK